MVLTTLGEPPRKAAIYLRISQDREMDGLAIDRQRERCEELAKYRRWVVPAREIMPSAPFSR